MAVIFDPYAADAQTQPIWIATNDGLLKSEDGGQSWTLITSIVTEAIALNPLHPETIYGSNPEGVSKSNDSGASWQVINEGLTGIVPSYLGINPLNPAIVYGVSAGIFGSPNGGEAWQRLAHEGGGPSMVDPANPGHVVAGTSIADDGWHFDRKFTIPMPPEMDANRYQRIVNSIVARPGQWFMGVGYMDNEKPYFNYDGGGGIYLSEDGG